MRGGCDAARRKEKCEDEGESRVGWLFIGVQIGLHVFSVPTTDSILIQNERGNRVVKQSKVNESCIFTNQTNLPHLSQLSQAKIHSTVLSFNTSASLLQTISWLHYISSLSHTAEGALRCVKPLLAPSRWLDT